MRLLLPLLLFPIVLAAQTSIDTVAVHLREIPKHNLSIDLGIAQPINEYGNIARSGLSIAVAYDYYLNKTIGLSVAGRQTYNETAFINRSSAPQNEKMTSVTTGLIVSKTFNRFQIDAFLRGGIGFIDTNDGIYRSANDNEIYGADNALSSKSSFIIDSGLRFNYYFRRSVQLYFSPQVQQTLSKPLKYRNTIQSILPSTADNSKKLNISNLIFSVGVKIAIGRKYTSGELRDDREADN
jgi:hypothetical protein